VPRVLVRRTASPAHADFGGLSLGAALVFLLKKLIFSEEFRGFSRTLASPPPCTTLALVRRRLGG
jgi:hypothetical protein